MVKVKVKVMVMYEPAKKESQIATNISPQILDDDR